MRLSGINHVFSSRVRCRIILLTCTCAAAALSVASAQGAPALNTPDSTTGNQNSFGQYVSRRELMVVGAAAVATGVLAPLDHTIQHGMQAEDLQDNRDLRQTASALGFSGGPGPFIAGGALYIAGRGLGSTHFTSLGLHLTEGVVVAAALNGLLKGVSGRALPNARSAEPGDFSFGRGFHDRNGAFVSFPSGHTAATFAAAAVLTDEVAQWDSSAARLVRPAAYSAAALVALSRLYQNVHWASDLPLGAAIGVLSGKAVVSWHRRHPANWLDRHLVGVSAAPTGRGFIIGGTASISPSR